MGVKPYMFLCFRVEHSSTLRSSAQCFVLSDCFIRAFALPVLFKIISRYRIPGYITWYDGTFVFDSCVCFVLFWQGMPPLSPPRSAIAAAE